MISRTLVCIMCTLLGAFCSLVLSHIARYAPPPTPPLSGESNFKPKGKLHPNRAHMIQTNFEHLLKVYSISVHPIR